MTTQANIRQANPTHASKYHSGKTLTKLLTHRTSPNHTSTSYRQCPMLLVNIRSQNHKAYITQAISHASHESSIPKSHQQKPSALTLPHCCQCREMVLHRMAADRNGFGFGSSSFMTTPTHSCQCREKVLRRMAADRNGLGSGSSSFMTTPTHSLDLLERRMASTTV